MENNNNNNNCECQCNYPEGIYFDVFKQRVSKQEYDNQSRVDYGFHYSTEYCEDCRGIVYLAIM